MDQDEKEFIAYKAYVDLWAAENPIKTNKLMALLIVNGLLVSALQIGGRSHIADWPVFAAGAVFSAIWIMSIGRTTLFQKVWRIKAIELSKRHAEDPRFQLLDTDVAKLAVPGWLRLAGGVSSKYYLMGTPVLLSLAWIIGLIFIILK